MNMNARGFRGNHFGRGGNRGRGFNRGPHISDSGQHNVALQIAESHQCNNLSFETSDPANKDSRIYVGNIAKNKVTRSDLFVIFSKYGIITAISHLTHKNQGDHCSFAFVQYSTKDSAERAVLNENRRGYYGYALDVKLAEFSAGTQKQKISPSGPNGQHRAAQNGTLFKRSASSTHQSQPQAKRSRVETAQPSDILVCGSCHKTFEKIEDLIRHKRIPCKPVTRCRCADENIPEVLTCAICYKPQGSPMQLISHIHRVHAIMICSELAGAHQGPDGGEIMGAYIAEDDGQYYDDDHSAMIDIDRDLMEEEVEPGVLEAALGQ